MSAQAMQIDMQNNGLQPAVTIIDDGVFRRIDDANGKPNNKLIAYVCFGNAGYYWHGSKLNEGKNWSIKNEIEFTAQEKADYLAKILWAKQQRAIEQERIHSECRLKAKQIWETSEQATAEHPYLIHKNIKPHHAKLYKGNLIIPVYDVADTLHGLQFIDENGVKKFLSGTSVKGNFSCIQGDDSKPIHICEGFATAATVAEITGATTVIAFSCGNLEPVVKTLSERLGGAK